MKAARAAIDKAGGDVIFTARSEGFIRGRPDIDETIRRLKAFADAGADCLYSPGIKTREHIEATVKAVGGKAINFLNSGALGFTVSDLAGMGVRRISVGGSLARVAMHAFIKTATQIAQDGKFDGFADLISNADLNKFFGEDRKKCLMAAPAELPVGPAVDFRDPRCSPERSRCAAAMALSSVSTPRGIARRCGWRCAATTRSGPIMPPGPFPDQAEFDAYIAACER